MPESMTSHVTPRRLVSLVVICVLLPHFDIETNTRVISKRLLLENSLDRSVSGVVRLFGQPSTCIKHGKVLEWCLTVLNRPFFSLTLYWEDIFSVVRIANKMRFTMQCIIKFSSCSVVNPYPLVAIMHRYYLKAVTRENPFSIACFDNGDYLFSE